MRCKIKLIIFTLIFAVCIADMVFALPNPAAVYCEKLGYEYKIIKDPDGSETGVCVVSPGVEFDAWAFFRGEVGKEYSYCAKHGYDTESEVINKARYSIKCAMCVSKKTFLDKLNSLLGINVEQKRVPMLDLMKQNGEPLIDIQQYQIPQEARAVEGESSLSKTTFPSSFDWRNYNGANWITPVKDQGGCDSCWAFSAVGAVEAKANIDTDSPYLDYDLSEQQLVSCGGGGGCGGGDPTIALGYIRDTGITTEDCFPYTATDEPCSDRCTSWQDEAVKITGFNWPWPSGTTQAYKQALMDYGPLSFCTDPGDIFFNYYDGVYESSSDNFGDFLYHCVVLVGWDDSDTSWIIKNSWGTGWGRNGYGKVHYGGEWGYTVDQTFAPRSLHFSSSNYTVDEHAGSATITVTHVAPTTGVISTDYSTSDGTAIAGVDYIATSGTLTFASGETSKTFAVPIIDHPIPVGDMTINLTLSNPTGDIILGRPFTAVLTIIDWTIRGVPSGLTGTAGRNYVFLYWNPVPYPDFLSGYNVYRSTSSSPSTATKVNGDTLITSNSYQDIYLSLNITYYYWVTAVDNYDYDSDYSNMVEVTTNEGGNGGDNNGGDGGNGSGESSKTSPGTLSGCFIATACYGTPMANEVKILNRFRDERLLTNPIGTVFVKTYYKVSPPIADFMREHPILKSVVKDTLRPLIWMAKEFEN